MEKLILSCGRYVPQAAGDVETRMRAMDAYLVRLSEEIEVLLLETSRALAALQATQTTAAITYDRGEGDV